MQIRVTEGSKEEVILKVAGIITGDQATTLKNQISAFASQNVEKLTLEMSGVKAIDSHGVIALIESQQWMIEQKCDLEILNLPDHVRRLWRATVPRKDTPIM